MIYILLFLSVFLSTMRNIFSKEISDAAYKSKQFFFNQALIFGTGSIILAVSNLPIAYVSAEAVFYAMIYGVLLISAQYCYTSALSTGNVGICSTVYSLGFIFPTLSGSIFWNETLDVYNIIGVLLVFLIIVLCGMQKGRGVQNKTQKFLLPLIVAMLSSGGLGIVQKFQQNSPCSNEKGAFLVLAFSLACIISLLFCFISKNGSIGKDRKKIAAASGIGEAFSLSNLFNTILAGRLDSAVFFPILNVFTILFSMLSGFVLYREKLTKKDAVILLLGFTAIILIG